MVLPDSPLPGIAQPARATLCGVLLAGGKSSRLGQDKAMLDIGGKNNCMEHGKIVPATACTASTVWQTQLGRTLLLLHSLAGQVFIAGRKVAGLPDWCQCIDDCEPGCGPMAGLLSALCLADGPCLALPVDLPFMEKTVLEMLVAARMANAKMVDMAAQPVCRTAGPGDASGKISCAHAVTQFVHGNGKLENLVAIYEQGAKSYLAACLQAKKLKLGLAIPQAARRLLPVPAGKEYCFFNLNTASDLEKAREMARTINRQNKKGK